MPRRPAQLGLSEDDERQTIQIREQIKNLDIIVCIGLNLSANVHVNANKTIHTIDPANEPQNRFTSFLNTANTRRT